MSSRPPAGALRRRQALAVAAAVVLATAAGPLRAQVAVEGYVFPAQQTVAEVALRINGVGYRAVAWIKGYAAGLYLRAKATTVEAVLADAGPKRLRMRMMLDVPAEEFVKAFEKGVGRNSPPGSVPALRARMDRFDAQMRALGQVRKGDLVDLDYVPGQGLRFSHNGRAMGPAIEGADFYAALLGVFIGPKPVDKELKIGLLGGPVG